MWKYLRFLGGILVAIGTTNDLKGWCLFIGISILMLDFEVRKEDK